MDLSALTKIIEESENISVDEKDFAKHKLLLDIVNEGVLHLDRLKMPVETEPCFYSVSQRQNDRP